MRFIDTGLAGAYVIELEERRDSRGFFARTFDSRIFAEHGLNPNVAQCNLSYNLRKGTLRGVHYQEPPAAEAKLVRCIRGAIWDVAIDLRPDSPTYLRHFAIELSAENRLALYIPERFGAAYQSLSDGTEVTYQVSEFYTPELERGLRYDDPVLGIEWPLPVAEISPKDASWPLLQVPERVR